MINCIIVGLLIDTGYITGLLCGVYRHHEQLVTDWEGRGRNGWWHDLKQYFSICVEGLVKNFTAHKVRFYYTLLYIAHPPILQYLTHTSLLLYT
jgi:hypothetical protein